MPSDRVELVRPGNVHLVVHRWTPAADIPVVGGILVVHGLAEHGARYARFAADANARGYVVYAPDHRGHGQTAARDEDVGHFGDRDGWQAVVADLAAVAAAGRDAYPDVPWFLLGHSMGTTLSLHLLAEAGPRFRAVVLSAPPGFVGPIRHVGALVTRLERWRLGRRGKSWLLDKMSFGDFNKAFAPARTAFDWLSRDPDEVDHYVADPRCGFLVTNQHWLDHLAAIEAYHHAPLLARLPKDVPLSILAGDADPVSQGGRQIKPFLAALRVAGLKQATFKAYAGARHEILNETNRAEVTADVLGHFDAAR
jgi:alpha-beta hydrolase superfamily lysophospholipase